MLANNLNLAEAPPVILTWLEVLQYTCNHHHIIINIGITSYSTSPFPQIHLGQQEVATVKSTALYSFCSVLHLSCIETVNKTIECYAVQN